MPASERPNRFEFHVLLALAEGPRYGYDIKSAVEEESDGALQPGAGSLYRVLGRLMDRGLVTETAPPPDVQPHPGHARRYYRLTALGERTLRLEIDRLRRVTSLAVERLGGSS